MPYLSTLTPQPHLRIALWHLTEDADMLLAAWGDAPLPPHYDVAATHKRRCEILAVMLLLRRCFGEDVALQHHSDGSPCLLNGCNISVSHTARYVAVALSWQCRVSVDVEMLGTKAPRAATRFLQPAELAALPSGEYDAAAHICWSAKEVAYKLFPADAADYTCAITLSPVMRLPDGSLTARVGVDGDASRHVLTVWYMLRADYVLAYACEGE